MTSRHDKQAPSSSDIAAGEDVPGIQARQHGAEATPSFRMNITSIKQPLAPQLSMPDVPRPPLRSRSTDGLTVSSVTHDVDATTATRTSYDGRGGTAGNEFVVADVPSPVLMNPSQGLNGLSEALAHLVTENAARSHVTASPAMSRQASNEADGVYAPSAISAAIASATRSAHRASGVRTTGPSTRQASSDMTTNHSSPPTAMTSISSRSPSDGVHGKNTSGGATKTAGFASGKSSRAASGARTPTAFAMLRRGSNDASRSSSPGSSGKSTPLFTFASGARTKPKVLETNRLQLNTHTPSGRRMINHYIIEDELGRGVHGKVRLARDTDTGERVAVKIVEREGKKRLGGGPNWAVRAAAASKSSSKEVALRRQSANEDATGESSSMAVDQDKSGDVGNGDSAHAAQQQTRFASPPSSPSVSARAGDVSSTARQGRRVEGMFADRDAEKEREKARKRLLWTTDQKVKREIALMKKCAHENVVRLREVIDDPQSKKIFMVLEYMEGGEVRWKDDRGFPTLTVDQARRTLRDVVLGLEYLHYQGIIHRDIKPANLLWDKEHRLVKISDFGVSHFSYALLVASGGLPSLDSDEERQRDPSLADDRELAKTAGSPAFFAPELCMAGEPVPTVHSVASGNSLFKRGTEFPWTENGAADESARPVANKEAMKRTRPPITKAIDVWALGVTLYCLLFGHVPFTADSEYALFNVIMKEDYSLPHYMGADRVRIGLRKKRWMYQQPWTDEEGDVDEDDAHSNEPDIKPAMLGDEALMVRDLLDRLLEKDPSKRISLEEVKKHPWLTRGLADPPLWLRKTDPAHLPYVEVTNEDVETALTGFSKFKQTIKRFQHKFFSTLSGAHTPVTEHSPPARDSTRSHSKGGTATMAGQPLHRRRRSKSASQASREAVMSSIEAKAPHSTSTAKNKAPSPPVALSGRPHLFFSRRRSTALEGDDGKNPLGLAAMAAGMSVSQPNSRPHSPMGSKERLTEQKPMLLPPRHADGASHSTPMASLTPIVSGEVATDQHDSLSASMARLGARPPKAGQNRMRPSSRGSLRTLEAFHFLHDPRRGTEGDASATDAASPGSRPRSATVSPSTSVRDGSRAATEQPARTRSRPRLGEVFRNVWHGGSHNGHADDGTSSRSFRFRSRPITAASSSSVSPSLEKSVAAAAVPAQRSTGDGGIATAAASRAVRADSPLSEPPSQQPVPAERDGGDTARVIDVDDYDVDLDLSDDDSDVEQRRSSVQPHRVLRGTSTGGWAVESMSRQQSSVGGGGGSHESGGHTTGEDSHQSATPSVEGGYNLYKPPFVGRFQFTDPFAPPGGATSVAEAELPHSVTLELADSSEAAALRRGSEVVDDDDDEGDVGSGEEVHHVTLPVRTHAAAISTGADANAALDTSVDRFADADELSEEEQHRDGAAQDHDYDDDDDDDDDEDDCVSFQAGRRQPAH